MARDLVINTSLEIQVAWSVRRKDQTIRYVTRMPTECSPLIRWFLESAEAVRESADSELQRELPAALVELAIAQGFIVPEDEVPDDAAAYRCSLNDEVLALVTREARARAMEIAIDPGALEVSNARLQLEEKAPPDIVRRAPVDDELAAHLKRPTDVIDPQSRIDARPPLAWIENRTSGVIEPLGLDGERGAFARAVLEQRLSPSELAPELRADLFLAGLLRPHIDDEHAVSRARLAAYRAELETDDLVVLRDVVSPLQVAAFRRHARALWAAGFFEESKRPELYPERDGVYCERWSLYVQRQLAPLLSAVVADELRPSFAWIMRYRPGAFLAPHTDRPQCTWNVTLAVDHDPDLGRQGAWPFVVETPTGAHPIQLGLGDAVLYRGTRARHWRDQLGADNVVTVCTFHYVGLDFEGSLR